MPPSQWYWQVLFWVPYPWRTANPEKQVRPSLPEMIHICSMLFWRSRCHWRHFPKLRSLVGPCRNAGSPADGTRDIVDIVALRYVHKKTLWRPNDDHCIVRIPIPKCEVLYVDGCQDLAHHLTFGYYSLQAACSIPTKLRYRKIGMQNGHWSEPFRCLCISRFFHILVRNGKHCWLTCCPTPKRLTTSSLQFGHIGCTQQTNAKAWEQMRNSISIVGQNHIRKSI